MIDTTLIEKIAKFEEMTGRKPLAIYLGYEEIMQLKNCVEFAWHQQLKRSHNLEFYGTKVYKVTVNNHIGIGF